MTSERQHPNFPFLGAERVALQEFLFRRTIPVFGTVNGQDAIAGTGSLFRQGDRRFLITAAHVLDLIEPGSLAIPDGHLQAKVWTIPNGTIYRPRSPSGAAEYDIAVVHIRGRECLERLERAWSFLELSDIATASNIGDSCIISGFPDGLSTIGSEETTGGYVMFATKVMSTPKDAQSPIHNDVDVFLELGATSQDLKTGEIGEPIRLNGVSGASVWRVLPDGDGPVWSLESRIKVVAIQSAARHKSYIRAKNWRAIYELLARI